jgi:hypothetical protein
MHNKIGSAISLIALSKEIIWKRGAKSVAPANFNDASFSASPLNINSNIGNFDIPVIYAFSEDLKKALVTLHQSSEKLIEAPFFYQSQIADAKIGGCVLSTSLHDLFQNPPITPLFVISPGRVGSTLFSNILKCGNVPCLSEPDVLSSFKIARYTGAGPADKQHFTELLKLSIESFYAVTGAPRFAIKLRSYSATLIPLLSGLFPHGKYIFLFRNIENWAISMVRAFGYDEKVLAWVINQNIQALRRTQTAGVKVLIVNYDNLLAEPEAVIDNVRHYLGSEFEFNMTAALHAMAVDSQQGTRLERAAQSKKTVNRAIITSFMTQWDKMLKDDFHELGIAFLK